MPELAVNSPSEDEPTDEPTQDERMADMRHELRTAYQHIDELHALLAKADKVCEYAEHGRICRGAIHAFEVPCDCGLQEAEDAYHILKGQTP